MPVWNVYVKGSLRQRGVVECMVASLHPLVRDNLGGGEGGGGGGCGVELRPARTQRLYGRSIGKTAVKGGLCVCVCVCVCVSSVRVCV